MTIKNVIYEDLNKDLQAIIQARINGIRVGDATSLKDLPKALEVECYAIDYKALPLNPERVREVPNPAANRQPANERRCCCSLICDLFRRIFS